MTAGSPWPIMFFVLAAALSLALTRAFTGKRSELCGRRQDVKTYRIPCPA
jgi:hypothetical protein